MSKIVMLWAALAATAAGPLAASAASAAEARTAIIEIRGMKFEPATLTIAAGTRVTWVNDDTMPHTVADKGHVFRSAALDVKDQYSFTFATPGDFTYFCTLHPFMVGRVIVRLAGSSS